MCGSSTHCNWKWDEKTLVDRLKETPLSSRLVSSKLCKRGWLRDYLFSYEENNDETKPSHDLDRNSIWHNDLVAQ